MVVVTAAAVILVVVRADALPRHVVAVALNPTAECRRWRPKIFMGEMLVCFGMVSNMQTNSQTSSPAGCRGSPDRDDHTAQLLLSDDLAGHGRVPPPAWGLAVAPKSPPTPMPVAAAGVRRRP